MIPHAEITEKGITVPSTDEIKSGLWEMMASCFGSDINKAENTPQGQLVVALTAILQDRDYQLTELINQFDPVYAKGRFQDALGNIYFMNRKKASKSVATVVFTGGIGVEIEEGFILKDSNGEVWKTTENVQIGNDGTATCLVESEKTGGIQAQKDTINEIQKALTGVDRVTNPNPAIIGRKEEGQLDFEERRKQSTQKNSQFIDSALRAELDSLDGVIDVWVQSNFTDQPTTFGATNYPVLRNSVCISIVGGKNEDIAWAALKKAGTGASFNGNTNPLIYDRDTYLAKPIAYRVVKFIRPKEKRIYFKLTIGDYSTLSANDETTLKQSIISAFSSGNNRARIAQTITAFQYACASNATTVVLANIQVSENKKDWVSVLNLGIDEFPVTSLNDIYIESIND